MKKVVALLLSSAMLVTGVTGLAACKPDEEKPAEGFQRLVDPRSADAFEVYSKEGEKVGAYRSIALAINAAVENDLDEFEASGVSPTARGSYVMKKGGTHKIFENMVKYSADVADDAYWYYNNNSLAGFEYWTTGAPLKNAQNTKNITYQVSKGTSATLARSSYGLYDGLGQQLNSYNVANSDRGFELVANTDASIKGIPVRDSGATGAKYELDLSDVQIKPAYEGVEDDVYAFFGFTIGAGTYSVEIGLACDVNTGAWKQYVSENPHNNWLTVTTEYNIGETIFTSSWNKEGGYYTPDLDTVTLEIKEIKGEDDLGDEYWYNQLDIKAGEKSLTFIVDDEYLQAHGNAGASFDKKNGFFFSAGLDIVAPGAEIGDDIKAPDYTIGATFENLVVADAQIWFPEEDEISNEEYGAAIDPALRGQYHSIRSGFQGITQGVYNYTILNVNACVDYEMTDDGGDAYSFRYDNYEVPESDFAGALKTYQDEIDALKAITTATAGSFKAAIDKVAAWRGPDGVYFPSGEIPLYCYLVIDWTPYENAVKVFNDAVALSEAGTALLNDFKALTNIDSVAAWKGWKAESGDTKGYLYNELQLFKGYNDRLAELNAQDKSGINQLVGDQWDAWAGLLADYTAIVDSEFANKQFKINNLAMTAYETKTGLELVEEFFQLAYNAYKIGTDKAENHVDHGGAFCVETVSHFENSFRMFYIDWLLEQEGVQLNYRYSMLDMLVEYCIDSGSGSYPDFQYIAAVSVQLQRIITKDCYYLDEELADVVNNVMYQFPKFANGSWHWAYTVNGGDLNTFGKGWKRYFGEELQAQGKTFRDLIQTYLQPIIERDSDAKFMDVTANNQKFFGLGVDKKVTAVTIELSAAGEAWQAKWNELSDITTLSVWKGWSTNGDEKGYFYNELQTYKALAAEYEALSNTDKLAIQIVIGTAFDMWDQLGKDYAALQANQTQISVWNKNFTAQENKTLAEIFVAFMNGAVAGNTAACSDAGAHAAQGLLCAESEVCGVNTVYTLYLNKVLESQNVSIAYRSTVYSLLQNEGSGITYDFDHIWYMGKQVIRILDGLDYLDEQLAAAVNTYMFVNPVPANNSFRNGTWSYYYRSAWFKGSIKRFNDWVKAIDPRLHNLMVVAGEDGFYMWYKAISKVNEILTQAGYGANLLAVKNLGGNAATMADAVPLYINCKVDVQTALGDIEQTVDGVVGAFNKLKLHDLTNPREWVGGRNDGKTKGYIYDEVQLFNQAYVVYKKLSAADQNSVKAQIATFAKWAELSDKFAALEADETKYSIVNGNATTVYENPVTVNGLAIVCAFFNFSFTSYDATIAHATTGNIFGYFCLEDQAHFLTSIRALYLHKLIEVNEIDFPFADEMLNAMAKLESTGNSKYTGITETEGAIKDFDYLWNVGKQIKRIKDGQCTYLDEELAAVINKYMVARGTKDKAEGGYGCYESFYHMGISGRYRNNAHGVTNNEIGFGSDWERYIGLDATETWAQLLATYLNPIILRDAGDILISPRNTTFTPMVVSREVTAVTGPVGN